jgi:hypothetical protein
MPLIHEIDINSTGILMLPIKIVNGQASAMFYNSLLDTGAGLCHITYPAWRNMGMNEVCFNDNPTLMKQMGIYSPDDLTFDNMPLTRHTTELGNGMEINAYEARLDQIYLGKERLGLPPITIENITIRIIDSDKRAFIVGWNILKYLSVNYNPSLHESQYQLMLTKEGRKKFQYDRENNISNYLKHRFNYIQDA